MMKRAKNEPPGNRRFRLSHLLLGIAALYLIFISFKFPQFLEMASLLSGDERHGVSNEDYNDRDRSNPTLGSVYKNTFYRKLEDNENLNVPKLSHKDEKGEALPIKPLQHHYGQITGEIMRRQNRTMDLLVLQRMEDEAWTLGSKAWEEVSGADVADLSQSSVLDRKPELCPSWVQMRGEDLAKRNDIMFSPCGLAAGSSITVVGTPHKAHIEFVPQLARLRKSNGSVWVSHFVVELQGLKSVVGEDPLKIFHLNPRLRGDWSQRPVIEHNTCYRMQWVNAQRCDGLLSKNDDDMLVDGHVRCEKWMRNDIVDTKDSKSTYGSVDSLVAVRSQM